MRLTRRVGTVSIAVLSLLVAAEARANNAGKHDADSLAREADEQPGNSASAAAVDRQGKLRAITPEEARALVDAMAPYVNQSSEGLTPVRQENGVMAIDLQDRFQSVSLARIAGDGSAVVRCVTTKQEAEQFLAPDAQGSASKDRKGSARKARAMTAPSRAGAPTTAATTTAATTTAAPLEEK